MNDSETGSEDQSSNRKLVLEDKAVIKELRDIPNEKRDLFLANLEMVRLGLAPGLRYEKLKAAGEGVMELKINGSPAYRCMYVVTKDGDVVVLHTTAKTAQGQSRKLIETTSQRLKRLVPRR